MILKLRDPSYTERLAAFLSSVGLSTAVVAPDRIEVTATSGRLLDASELEIYLRVWHVLEPKAHVEIER